MERSATVLVVDDEPNILEALRISIESMGMRVLTASSPLEALDIVRSGHDSIEVALLDLKMHPIDGIDLMRRLLLLSPDLTPVIITAHGTVHSAVAAIKHGAFDYVQKPFELDSIREVLERAVSFHRQRSGDSSGDDSSVTIVTSNDKMLEQIALARRVASTPLHVLIEGESGTGKELVASLIHSGSERSDGPFVTLNCAALPDSLLESELFGHVRGAFTGAVADRAGRFELADGGTLFLDEIGEMPLHLQSTLLRAVQQGEFQALGDPQTRRVDVRIVSATNRTLRDEVKEGRFREDLFYRINGVGITLPPLRERPEDIEPLVLHLASRYVGDGGVAVEITPPVLAILRRYEWPGNVRELENLVARLVYLSGGRSVELRDLPSDQFSAFDLSSEAISSQSHSLKDVEREHIRAVLARTESYDDAARVLGIDPATLWRKRKKFGL